MLCFSSSPPHLCAHVDSPSARDGGAGGGRGGGWEPWRRGQAGEGRGGAGGFNTCLTADDLLPRFLPPSRLPPRYHIPPSVWLSWIFEAFTLVPVVVVVVAVVVVVFLWLYDSPTSQSFVAPLSLLSSSTAPPPLILSLPHFSFVSQCRIFCPLASRSTSVNTYASTCVW